MSKKEILIYSWSGAYGLESTSGYCFKVVNAAKFKKIPFKIKYVTNTMPGWAKKGTLPVAEFTPTLRVEDSSEILVTMEHEYPDTPKLYPANKEHFNEVRLLEDWSDEYLTSFVVWSRWGMDEGWQEFEPAAFSNLSWWARKFVLPFIRRRIARAQKDRVVAHSSSSERSQLFKSAITILESKLQREKFLVCDQVTAADISVYSVLKQLLPGSFPELNPSLKGSKLVMEWIGRMDQVLK